MSPIVVKQPYAMDYNYSYGQDSPFFAALANGRFIVCREPQTGYTYATPRGHDMYSGRETQWVEIKPEGKIHAFTVCHFGSEAFLPECPFVLIQVEFEECDTLFLGRLIGVDPHDGEHRLDRQEGAGPVPAQRQAQADRYLLQSGPRISAL